MPTAGLDMGVETELKLLVEPGALRKVAALAAVRSRKAGRARTEQLLTRYYDTPDRALEQAGMALRVCRSGNAWVQTVKTAGSGLAGLQARGEWEARLDDAAPSLQAVKSTPAFKVLGGGRGFKSLLPVFETDFQRILQPLSFADGSTCDLCLDSGAVKSGKRSSPISEIELELTHGQAARLFELAEEMLDAVPLRIGRASKAERGYALAARGRELPVKADAPHVHKDASWDEAFRCIVAACVDHLLANAQGTVMERDPEFLHQMRVALRRLRSGLAVFRGHFDAAKLALVEAMLREAGRKLGAARDWDVLNAAMLRPFAAAFADDQAVRALVRKAARMRAAHARSAREFVASAEFMRGALRIGRLLASPGLLIEPGHDPALPLFAARTLQSRHRRVRKMAARLHLDIAAGLEPAGGARAEARHGRGLPYPELHRLRIAAKKLRYAAEFFESLFRGGRARPYIRALARLQDALGGLNDCAKGGQLLDELGAVAARADQALAQASARGWLAANRSRRLSKLPAAWADFREQPRFWKAELPELAHPDPGGSPADDGDAGEMGLIDAGAAAATGERDSGNLAGKGTNAGEVIGVAMIGRRDSKHRRQFKTKR